jgi:hypothetical protein
MRSLGNTANKVVRSLEDRLPSGWRLKLKEASSDGPDIIAEVRAPDGQRVRFAMEVKKQMEPRDVHAIAAELLSYGAAHANVVPVLAAPFLTARTRQLLGEAGLSYLDLTGNCSIVSSSPGLYISTSGIEKRPPAPDRAERSLRGRMAGRIVRDLCDFRPPVGVRALAQRVGCDAGYVSRLLHFLEREALISRKGRGPVEEVQWKSLIERWVQDYNPFAEDRLFQYLEPRGLEGLTAKIRKLDVPCAFTASLAAYNVAPVAPPRLVTCYVDDPERVADELGLHRVESGMNVRLVIPFDNVVYERTWERKGLTFVAHSQIAADLLRSPGRGPAEAEKLLDWMAKNEDEWRS